jgi:type I restriction enzyme M protein
MANNHSATERRLWDAADEFRANSDLKSSEYATPVLGLVFLRYADHRFTLAEKELAGKGSGRRTIGKEDYQAKGVMYLPPAARFSHLLSLPEGENIGKAINEAMKAVEAENDELKGVLPRTYTKIDNSILVSLLKNFSQIALDAEGDTFGKI